MRPFRLRRYCVAALIMAGTIPACTQPPGDDADRKSIPQEQSPEAAADKATEPAQGASGQQIPGADGENHQPMPPIQEDPGTPARVAVDHSRSIVAVERDASSSSYHRAVGETIKLKLDLGAESIQGWSKANVGRFVVRLPDGSQRKVERGSEDSVSYRLDQPGAAMFIASVGASPDGVGRDSIAGNTHFSKVIVTVDAKRSRLPRFIDTGLTDKTGQPVELRPMVNPIGLAPRAMFPVKLYAFGKSQPGQLIEALGPSGQVISEHTDHAGLAHFYLPETGDWSFRWAARHQGQSYSAELAFSTQTLGAEG